MGRSFEILTTGYALSEKGVFLQHFLESRRMPGIRDGRVTGESICDPQTSSTAMVPLVRPLDCGHSNAFCIAGVRKHAKWNSPNSPAIAAEGG